MVEVGVKHSKVKEILVVILVAKKVLTNILGPSNFGEADLLLFSTSAC